MAIPRADGGIPARVKKLEDTVRRIQLMPSVSQAAVAPLAVAKSSVWYDSSAGNGPSYWNGTAWVPVRDETIAVAQGAADVAQSTAVGAAADAAAAVAATDSLQTDLDAAEATVAAAQADIDTLTGTTLPALQTQVDAILPITETDISDDAITTPKIAANAITAGEIAANAVTTAKLDTGAVTAIKIAAGTITASEIAANAVTATQIAAGAIDGKTITGALIRTAASGKRLELDSNAAGSQMLAYSGNVSEVSPGSFQVLSDRVIIHSPDLGEGQASLRLYGNTVSRNEASLGATYAEVQGGGNGTGSGKITAGDGDEPTTPNNGVSVVTTGDGKFLYNGDKVAVSRTPASNFSATANNGVTGTSFAAGTPAVGVTFVAPPSGLVWVTVQGHLEQTVAARFGYLAFEMRTGATIGSGTVNHTAVTQEGVGTGLGRISASNRTLVDSLTPGASYNARTMHVATPSGATVNVIYRGIVVEPVL